MDEVILTCREYFVALEGIKINGVRNLSLRLDVI